MGIKKYNPTTPARRQMTVSTFEEITGKSEIRTLMTNVKKNAGRNSYGRITVRHHGGGNKRQYRVVDFKRDKDGIPAKVASIEYDPNRSRRNPRRGRRDTSPRIRRSKALPPPRRYNP